MKELRRIACKKNVPLTQISAAVEKSDLITLILRAGPVSDTYDVNLGVKIHSSSTIEKTLKDKGKKKTRKRKRPRSTSRSSSSPSCRSLSRGRKKKKGGNGRRSNSPDRKHGKSVQKGKSVSRSPSLVMVVPPKPVHGRAAGRAALRALPPAPQTNTAPVGGLKAIQNVDLTSAATPAKLSDQPTNAEKGMAAAAALGFDILPKERTKMTAPAEGLRPTINTCAPVPFGVAGMPGGRICIQYLCTSRCDLGGNCPESHIIDPEEEMRVRARFKEQECHYGAQCSRPGCLFRHPGERFEEGRFLPEGHQVTLRATPQGLALEYV